IEGMLELGRVVKTDLKHTEVDVGALAREIERELRESDSARSAEFLIDDDMRVWGDRVLLRCVFANLLANAWKFTANRPHAHIHIGKMDSAECATVFFVRDNGAGFDTRYADKLFTPFQRLHAQDEFPGTGVGLATVQRVVMKHGGRIWAESQPD